MPLYGIGTQYKMKKAHTDLKAAEQTKKEAFTGYFPTVGATGAGFNANKGLLEMELAPGMGMSMLKNGIVGSITATQPLFTGGQIVNSNKLAKVSVEVSKWQLRQSENEVRLYHGTILLAGSHFAGEVDHAHYGAENAGPSVSGCRSGGQSRNDHKKRTASGGTEKE